ncbi:Mitogen-activated protein kinase kinase kinase [Sesamum angolense]|uniref:mitogen-activated protein kinase kinase kinase n=1 Tax=Sesamum angolense TaxID=2727404 RepID=A0AAE1WD21_9LAMI|nr:Mitogen-activated protein kinase kinase kinase [Sesamum angolense]
MHRIPKFFAHSSGRRKAGADSGARCSSSTVSAKPKPRLDRMNAMKNINYEFSPSSTSASSSSSYYSAEESQRTRSLDFYGGKTSFRIDGIDGEIEIFCQTLGFSGIDDFAIPAEEYEAMKVRSSSAPVVSSQAIEPLVDWKMGVNYDEGGELSGDSAGVGGVDVISQETEGSNMVSARISDVTLRDNVSWRLNESHGNGIKGVRPLILAPPPSISLPLIDKECSTWDILRSFAPESDTSFLRFKQGFCSEEDEEGAEVSGRERNEDEDQGEDTSRRIMASGENCVPSGSCSFTTTSNDDDSSSTTTEPMSSISPNGRCKRVILEWQKGELLGRGSFGSVYEGIADDGFFFAVKEVSLLDQRDEGKQHIIQLEQEIALLSQFEHENIVQYYGTKKGYQMCKYLVDTNGSVKLADFGLAKATKLNDVKSCKGTALWMAPEVVRSLGYGLAADIWSLGCTVLEMLTRRFPYSNLEAMTALFRIGSGERPPIPDSLSSDARDFILTCLQVDPSLRPAAAQLLDHPFVKRPLASSTSL